MTSINNIRILSQENFNNIQTTDESTLYFVESSVVVESYVKGNSWYRVYSDGWIEQGGFFTATGTSTNIALLKSYTNSNYNLQLTDAGGARISYGYTKNNGSFTVYAANSGNGGSWLACGRQ